jgi:uncharacterized protein YbjQ (UPF0145 family)|tara:strand:- start:729 stop:1058 length:330 start_codon:yes stop_codon:yes gene_type:complete
MDSNNFLVVSSSSIDNKKIEEYLGIVVGSTVRARNVGSDFFASLKNLVGGEVVSYSRLLERARDQAYKRMIQEAKEKGANGIINFRFQTSQIVQGASEVMAYGTAVKIS